MTIFEKTYESTLKRNNSFDKKIGNRITNINMNRNAKLLEKIYEYEQSTNGTATPSIVIMGTVCSIKVDQYSCQCSKDK